MPIYEYVCPVCGCHFEKHQGFNDPPPQECPHGHRGVRRMFSPPVIIFKGSGFYTTDYGRNGSSIRSTKSNKSDSKSESKSKEPAEADESKTKTD